MKIAVDRDTWQVAKNDGNEYIYVYEDEDLEDLMKTHLRCVELDDMEDVDINVSKYQLNCKKRANINEEGWNILPPKKDFKIGIIIPNYNYEHTIRKCLNSVLNQTYKNYEIILVDDVSTDNSLKIEREYANTYPRITLVELKQKRLNGGARNEGYLHLSEDVDYVYYLDSDDWLYIDDALEKINNRLQSEPDVLFVGIEQFKNNKYEISFIPEYKDKYEAILGWSGSCGKVIKKELATRQECLYNEGTLKEDKNQHCKICIYMNTFQLLKEPVYVWNQSNYKSVTTVRRENPLWITSTIRHYADTCELYYKEHGKDKKIDEILYNRVLRTKKEMETDGDKQY